MRKALVVGIDYYERIDPLFGCVNDARSVHSVLKQHEDGTANFGAGARLWTATGAASRIEKDALKDAVEALFQGDSEIALFYFAGHGHVETTGGYLVASDARRGDDGLPLSAVLTFASKSPARNKIIVLDSCHSGAAGSPATREDYAELKEGTTILSASTAEQYASEENGHGVFTTLFVDALSGGAANLMGDVTPGSVYAHIDQSLGPWDQRPVFKTNVKNFVSLRKVKAPIPLEDLQLITALFPSAPFEIALDPTWEPERTGHETGLPPPNPDNTRKFAVLQKYNRVNLLVPVGAPHMWHAAMQSKSCKLTTLGRHYRQLRARDLF